MKLHHQQFIFRLLAASLCCLSLTASTAQEATQSADTAALSPDTPQAKIDAADATPPDADGASEQPVYLLRYQFQPGDQLRYETVQKLTQQGVAERGRNIDHSEIHQRRLFTVQDVQEDGQARVAMQFEHVKMQIQSGENPPEVFDSSMSEDEVPPRFRAAARNLKAAAPVYSVRPEGSLVNSKGIEEFPEGGQATFMIPLPADPISVGHSWKTNIVVKVRLDIKVNRDITLLRTYRLKSVENDVATIGFSTSVASTVKSPTVKAQLLQATPQGEIQFDLKHGRLVRKEIRIDNLALGVLGANSMLAANGTTIETLVTDEPAVTKR